MKKKLNKIAKNRIVLALLVLFYFPVYAQDFNQEEEPIDSVKTGNEVGKMILKDPKSVSSRYEYNPETDKYVRKKTIDDFNIKEPLVLTPSEFEALVRKEDMKRYFRKKIDAIDGKKENSEKDKRDLLPTYYVRSGFFESIFGSNTIDIKPIGNVEIDLGMRYTKQDNPVLSPRNRSTYAFDFDQRISLSLLGKVGTRLAVNTNYDTKSTFAFQNLLKLEYTPTEDDIIQKIELGNVSMPLGGSLIKGAQSLFGVKAQLKFGRTMITGIFSEQKSQTKTVVAEGGGTMEEFNMFALDYDADRHFFLSQYFRNRYDYSLRNYPFIDSRVKITRIEVWVTNRQNRVNSTQNNMRNIVALQDLGEAQLTTLPDKTPIPDDKIVSLNPALADFFLVGVNSPADNRNNKYNPQKIGQGDSFLNNEIRDFGKISDGFKKIPTTVNTDGYIKFSEGTDYSKLENARKLTSPSEFTYNAELGYLSLSQKLTNDEVLAVAYEYTIGDEVYKVGEFANDGVDATVVSGDQADPANQSVSSQALILKMLKSNLTNVSKPIWNLMMKNIYQIPGAYQLSPNDFKLNIVYSDPSPVNYITKVPGSPDPIIKDADVSPFNTPLLKVLKMDRLNSNNDPETGGDGFFDFVPGLTVDTQNGRVIFTTVEPFGKHLFERLSDNSSRNYNDLSSYNTHQNKYVFSSLYTNTQAASLQQNQKNKFQLKGRFKSTGGDGIPVGAFNVPKGSVRVTAGGRVLTEGVDYTVNYQAGRVQILDPALKASNIPIQVSVENNSVFGQQTRRYSGINIEHKFSDKFLIGGTLINLKERPLTQKSNYGSESVDNTIYGLNTNYSTEVPFLTRLINKYPTINTEAPSNISFRGEMAYLSPSTPQADRLDGESTVYVDDFEGSQSTIDLRSPIAWSLASTPIDFYDNTKINDLDYGYKRAKLAWYTIDPIFYTTQRPSEINDESVSLNKTRRIYNDEVFPLTDIAAGQTNVLSTLDLTYYPKERGPYNFNPAVKNSNTLPEPDKNWGGITRAITTTDFQQANVEYIQFWIQDPYQAGETNGDNKGRIVFNLGEISEDILKDGRKQYENGLPADGGNQNIQTTNWGKTPSTQSLVYAFDTNEANRTNQDVGFDGLNNTAEATKFPDFSALPDPAADDYSYYLNETGELLQRYKKYNGLQGNSPITVTDTNRGSTTLPDTEDINRDNTMNTIEEYYEYSIKVDKDINIGYDYVTNIVDIVGKATPDGGTKNTRWIQYKIPIFKPETKISQAGSPIPKPKPEQVNLNSVRFMRMYMTGFSDEVTVRFATLEFVRGDWRRYNSTLVDNIKYDEATKLDVLAVNIQENSERSPVKYVLPPGVQREQLTTNNTLINQNEQSLALRVTDLKAGDSRGVFKATSMDMRQFKKLKMFMHAESLKGITAINNGELSGFIRFGNDFTDNFYQVEVPLKVTPEGSGTSESVWPSENNLELILADLTALKLETINNPDKSKIITKIINNLTLGIKGNPDFGQVRNVMVGVKNNSTNTVSGEVWFNELRISDMNNEGGMAALASLDGNIADVATFSATGRMSTMGFGSVEQKPNERSREDLKQYDIVTNINVGRFLPTKLGLTIPLNLANGEQFITPEFDPFNRDVRLDLVKNKSTNADFIVNRATDYTKRSGISLIGVRKERAAEQKKRVYDIENITVNYSYNETKQSNYEIESLRDQKIRTGADYTYGFQSKSIEPLKKVKFLSKSQYLKLLQEINFKPLPDNISFSSNITRQMNSQKFRQVEDVQGIGIDPLYRRNFFFDYNYVINHNLTKSLKLSYTATNSNIVRNYLDEKNRAIDGFTIWDDFWTSGQANSHKQTFLLNYELPINKIPVFKFVKSQYNYTSNFDWRRSNTAMSTVTIKEDTPDQMTYNLGNTIQNSNTQALNTNLDMVQFYKYIGLDRKSNKKKRNPDKQFAAPSIQQAPPTGDAAKEEDKKSIAALLTDRAFGILTSVKTIQINYSLNNGTVLPGYLPSVGFFGTSAPTLGYVFGSQADIRERMAGNGYLTNYPEYNQNFTQVRSNILNLTAGIDLLPDFRIDVIADRLKSDSYIEQYDAQDGIYTSRSPYNSGNFSTTTILIGTAFDASSDTFSETFENFKSNRLIIANRLAEQYYGKTDFERYTDKTDKNFGYPVGFGKTSQQVLIPSFLSAYSGGDAGSYSTSTFKNIPLPNWTVKYSGLMKMAWFKDNFKRFSLHHGYKATYAINSYRSNFEYDKNPIGRSAISGDYFPKMLIANINLIEQFNPLIRMDFELKNSYKFLAEMKKDRTMSLSFDNNLLTEVRGYEYIVGMGYRVKNITINSRFAGNAAGVIKSDMNLRLDFSYRNNKTVIRYLDVANNDRLSGGQDIWTLKFTADYAFSKSLTAIMFYDHSFSQAVISTAFPLTNIRGGFTIRYNFGN